MKSFGRVKDELIRAIPHDGTIFEVIMPCSQMSTYVSIRRKSHYEHSRALRQAVQDMISGDGVGVDN